MKILPEALWRIRNAYEGMFMVSRPLATGFMKAAAGTTNFVVVSTTEISHVESDFGICSSIGVVSELMLLTSPKQHDQDGIQSL